MALFVLLLTLLFVLVEDHVIVEDSGPKRPLLKLQGYLIQLLQRHVFDLYTVVETQSLQ